MKKLIETTQCEGCNTTIDPNQVYTISVLGDETPYCESCADESITCCYCNESYWSEEMVRLDSYEDACRGCQIIQYKDSVLPTQYADMVVRSIVHAYITAYDEGGEYIIANEGLVHFVWSFLSESYPHEDYLVLKHYIIDYDIGHMTGHEYMTGVAKFLATNK